MKTDERIKGGQDGAHSEVALARQPYDLKVAPVLLKGSLQRSNMGIIRREKSENYSVIYNECFQNAELSARAKGIFAYLMTLPDDWKIYKRELTKHFKEGRDALNTAFDELESAGYITKVPERGEGGRLDGWDYTVYESTELLKTRTTVNPSNGEPATTKYLPEVNTKSTKVVASAPASSESSQSKQKESEQDSPTEQSQQKPRVPRKFVAPNISDVEAWAIAWAERKGKSTPAIVGRAREALSYYERLDWHDKDGKTIKNWKMKIAAVWFRDEDLKAPQKSPTLPTF